MEVQNMKQTIIERTFKLRVWEKESGKFAWSEIFTTTKTGREIEEIIEGQMVNTELYKYALDEY